MRVRFAYIYPRLLRHLSNRGLVLGLAKRWPIKPYLLPLREKMMSLGYAIHPFLMSNSSCPLTIQTHAAARCQINELLLQMMVEDLAEKLNFSRRRGNPAVDNM